MYQAFKTKTREKFNLLFGEKQFNRIKLITELKKEYHLLGFKGVLNRFNTERHELDDDDVINIEVNEKETSDFEEVIVVDTDYNQEVT